MSAITASHNGQSSPTSLSDASRSDWAIDLHDVTKVYRRRIKALDSMNMQVAPGEVFGLLGPNGAGKSTLVRIMMTVIRASQAHGTVLGRPVGHKPTLARIGYLPEHHRFPTYLTGEQVLHYYGALTGVSREERRKRAPALLDRVGMTKWADTKVRDYSKGMMQRVGLAQAIMNDPDLIVLDEPTDGVDPVGRKEIRDHLVELKAQGKTIFLNSHLLSEIEMVCDRVAILVKGRVATQGTIGDLTAGSRRYEIDYVGASVDPAVLPEDATCELTIPPDRRLIRVLGIDPKTVQPVIDHLRKAGATIHSVSPRVESLEDLFIRSVQDPETGKAQLPGGVTKADRRAARP